MVRNKRSYRARLGVVAAAVMLAMLMMTVPVFAGGDTGGDVGGDIQTSGPVTSVDKLKDSVKAKSVILIERSGGKVLYEKNPDEPLAPASITKVMTMLLVMEGIDSGKITLEDEVTASEHACSMGGSQIWLEPGETMSVHELLMATAVASANDAAVALAEYLAGSEDAFVVMMNERARELGMSNTNFMNASGLDEEGHFSSARDISTMAAQLLSHKKITEYTTIWMETLRNGETQLVNTNKLIRFYKGATGLKTGSTDEAGKCLAASAERDGMGIVAVVLGAENRDDQFGTAKVLLDYGFANYTIAAVPSIDAELAPIKIAGGVKESIGVKYKAPEGLVIKKGAEKELVQEIEIAQKLKAPVEEGAQVGKVTIKAGEEVLGEYELYAAESVGKMSFFRAFTLLYGELLK